MNDTTLIEPSEGPSFAVLRPGGASDVVLICEHASNALPLDWPALGGDLGLSEAAKVSHAAWDIGAPRSAKARRVAAE